MTQAPPPPVPLEPRLRADTRVLLARSGVPALPSPVALQLLDIPFVLPLKQLPERVGGLLPRWAYEVHLTLVGADRTKYEVRVTGDPTFGLPFGQDADVLLALFKILETEPAQHNLATGALTNPSYQMICRALGKAPTGRRFREIRDALTRLAGVRIYSRVTIDKTVLAARVLAADGGARPEVPTASTTRRDVTHEMRWLIEYRSTERTERGRAGSVALTAVSDRTPDGLPAEPRRGGGADDGTPNEAEVPNDAESRQTQMWIQHLAVNPFWVAQAVSGWAGWIDVERHARLKSPTARRLYQICAATAARQVAAPWAFAEGALTAACLLTTSATKKPTKVRRQLEDAAEELREAGLLASAAWQGPRRGPKTLEVQPAPLLQFADLLRGIGLTDPPDFRVQYAVLRHFGVTPAKARSLLAEHPGQVGEVLLRACHLEATDPGAIEKSWAGWIVHHVQAATSFRGEVDFQKWRSSALAALGPAAPAASNGAGKPAPGAAALRGPEGSPSDVAAGSSKAPAALRRHYPRPPADPTAQERWEAALAAVLPTASPFELYGLEVAVPVESTPEELVLWVHPDDVVAANTLARALPRLETALSAQLSARRDGDGADGDAGRPVRVRVDRHRRGAAE